MLLVHVHDERILGPVVEAGVEFVDVYHMLRTIRTVRQRLA